MARAAVAMVSLMLLAAFGCGGPQAPATADTEAAGAPAADEFVRDPAAITGITWEWLSTTTPVEQTIVPEPGRYTILLQPNGKFQARFDCNRGGGDYEIDEGRLSFNALISTRMACPEDSLDAPFLRDLERVTSFFVRSGELYLEMPVDSGTLRFRPAKEGP